MEVTKIPLGIDTIFVSLADPKVRKVTYYSSPSFVVKASKRHKTSFRDTRREVIITYGAPNYEERLFIKACRRAKEPFPVKKPQLKFWKGIK